jgi:hypothetical protein
MTNPSIELETRTKFASIWRNARAFMARSALIWLALVVIVALTRFSVREYAFNHGDEIIAHSVVHQMLASGTLDTNWASAKGMPAYFSYPQFNFSGYHIVLYLVSAVLRLQPDLGLIRDLNGLIHVVCAILAGLAARYLTRSWAAASFATVGVGLSPELIRESMIARADTLSVLLVLAIFLCIVHSEISGKRKLLSIIISVVLIGFSTSIKVTFISFAPVPLLQAWRLSPQQPLKALLLGLSCLVAILVGFIFGAPYAALHPLLYLNGIRVLEDEYSQGLWPFGLADESSMSRFAFAIVYFSYMIGVFNLVLWLGTIALDFSQRKTAIGLFALILVAQFLYFSLLSTFFGRNFGHIIPPMFVAIAVSATSLRRSVLARVNRAGSQFVALAFASAVFCFPLISTVRLLTVMHSNAQPSPVERQLSLACKCSIIDVPLIAGRSGAKYYSQAWNLVSVPGARLVRVIDFPSDPNREELMRKIAESTDVTAHFVRGPAPARNSALQFEFGFDYIILEKS